MRGAVAFERFFGWACLALASACGGTSGDPMGIPAADRLGTGARLHEILGPATWVAPDDMDSLSCTDIPLDRRIEVTGVTINAIDTFDETHEGSTGNIYVQDT